MYLAHNGRLSGKDLIPTLPLAQRERKFAQDRFNQLLSILSSTPAYGSLPADATKDQSRSTLECSAAAAGVMQQLSLRLVLTFTLYRASPWPQRGWRGAPACHGGLRYQDGQVKYEPWLLQCPRVTNTLSVVESVTFVNEWNEETSKAFDLATKLAKSVCTVPTALLELLS
jgi:hypothetical protein